MMSSQTTICWKRLKDEELSLDGISELDLYGEKYLWEIGGDISNPKDNIYFFTKLKKLFENRVGRTASYGVWNESSTDKIYDYKGDVIGARKLFCFKVKQGSCITKSNKIMHEFSLVGKQEQTFWVLCTFQKNRSNQELVSKDAFKIFTLVLVLTCCYMRMKSNKERGCVAMLNAMCLKGATSLYTSKKFKNS